MSIGASKHSFKFILKLLLDCISKRAQQACLF